MYFNKTNAITTVSSYNWQDCTENVKRLKCSSGVGSLTTINLLKWQRK